MIVVQLGNYWIFVFWIAISIATIELSVKTAVKAQVTSSSLSSSSSSSSSAIVASDIHHKPLRVAYVLAGSARSFIEPMVHQMIRINLLDSFCQADSGCKYDVFARVSTSDNNHFGRRDSVGVYEAGDESKKKKIISSLESLRPHESIGKLYSHFFEIGGPDELADMLYNEDFRRRIYRHLDSRRYSMYFNRWKAYGMLLDVERSEGFKYDWVVHCRLDMSWGAPILPVQYWTSVDIYTPDSWYSDVPDTFALLRRPVSDIYFDLDKMVDKNVYCAGGPDFDPSTLKEEYLMSKKVGFTKEEVALIQEENCLKRFPNYIVMYDKHAKVTWSMAGASEFFTKRKLTNHGLTIGKKTMEAAPFFAFVVRNLAHTMCYYLKVGHFIPWERTHKSVNAAIFMACDLFSKDVHRSIASPDQFSVCKYLPKRNDGSSCLLDKDVSDHDFMPFRIRFRGKCITASQFAEGDKVLPLSSITFNISECINFASRWNSKKNMEKYNDRQLFMFYPLVSAPQHISMLDNVGERRRCLTALPPKGLYSGKSKPRIKVALTECVYKQGEELQNQLFEVIIPQGESEKATFLRSKQNKEGKKDPTFTETSMYNKDRLLGLTSFARIRWTSAWDASFCLIIQSAEAFGISPNLVLVPCSESPNSSNSTSSTVVGGGFNYNEQNKKRDGHVFMLERSLVSGDPYKSGITVGEWPATV